MRFGVAFSGLSREVNFSEDMEVTSWPADVLHTLTTLLLLLDIFLFYLHNLLILKHWPDLSGFFLERLKFSLLSFLLASEIFSCSGINDT